MDDKTWLFLVVVAGLTGFIFGDIKPAPRIDGTLRVEVGRGPDETPVEVSFTGANREMCPPLFSVQGDAKGWVFKNILVENIRSEAMFSH